jgi:curved DNA-binding protein CbpA
MPARSLIPTDDLYARLEVAADASPETIEVAWRALLRRHHPDIAGPDGLADAKAINVAHDWLSDPVLRERYDRERGVAASGRPGAHHSRWTDGAAAPARPRPAARPVAEDPRAAIRRFLDRVGRLSADELDRLDLAEPAPIAFVASIQRFLTEEQLAAVEEIEAAVRLRLPETSWVRSPVRDAVLGFAFELVLGGFLDEHLDEPFRGRVRERLTRGWDAAVGQSRHGPNGRAVAALVGRVEALDAEGVRWLASMGTPARLGPEPWPQDASPEDDEALRVSSVLAGRDVAAVIRSSGLDRATLTRARRAVARLAHLVVIRHTFAASEWERLARPWRPLLDARSRASATR